MPLPIAHGLLGASIVVATLPDAPSARHWKLLLSGAVLASCPDLDYLLATSWHRGFTHSISFASIISAACVGAWGADHIRLAIGCACAVLSHGLLDFATTQTMPGVELLWPFSTRRFGLGMIDYYHLTGIDPTFFLIKDVPRDLLKAGMVELMIFLPIFIFVIAVKWGISKRSRP